MQQQKKRTPPAHALQANLVFPCPLLLLLLLPLLLLLLLLLPRSRPVAAALPRRIACAKPPSRDHASPLHLNSKAKRHHHVFPNPILREAPTLVRGPPTWIFFVVVCSVCSCGLASCVFFLCGCALAATTRRQPPPLPLQPHMHTIRPAHVETRLLFKHPFFLRPRHDRVRIVVVFCSPLDDASSCPCHSTHTHPPLPPYIPAPQFPSCKP